MFLIGAGALFSLIGLPVLAAKGKLGPLHEDDGGDSGGGGAKAGSAKSGGARASSSGGSRGGGGSGGSSRGLLVLATLAEAPRLTRHEMGRKVAIEYRPRTAYLRR